MTALQPFRVANTASISSTSSKPAEPAAVHPRGMQVQGNPPPPLPMKSMQTAGEVPLPSQEGSKGVLQYALYVTEGYTIKRRRVD